MESTDFSENFILGSDFSSLETETLTGWSAACLDEAISFYIDCNFSNIATEELTETE